MKRSLLLLALLPLTTLAQQPAAPAYEPKPIVDNIELKDGDTLVFLGDSITHQCLYTQYIETYYYTRFPKLRLNFHNSGVGGDRAADALRRFDEDVAAYKPKVVTILLGMNDGSYTKYEQPIFDTYQAGMNTVLDRIKEIGATAVPMTPTMHDSRARRIHQPAKVNDVRETYYNGVLALYGAWLREQAEVRGLGFVDMYSPLNAITLQQRTKDPKWTMIKDAVHPDAPGQVVMACAILADMVPRSQVSQTTIAERAGKAAIAVRNGKASDFTATPEKVSFTLEANALPWVLPPDAAEGYQLTVAGHRYSNEKLTVQTLKPGRYELKIDGEPVGAWSSEQLARGIELQANAKTPQYQQALAVAMLNKKRNDEAYRPLRDSYGQLKGQRRALDKAAADKAPDLDAKKAAFETWYAAHKTKVADLRAKAKAIEDQIYRTNQPKPHRYEIVPTAAPVAKRAAKK